MMYEITCKRLRTVDSVVEYIANMTQEELATTKMLLAELQGAIVARCLGSY